MLNAVDRAVAVELVVVGGPRLAELHDRVVGRRTHGASAADLELPLLHDLRGPEGAAPSRSCSGRGSDRATAPPSRPTVVGDGRSHDAFPRPPGAMVSRSCNSTSTVRRGSLGLLFRCVAIDTRPSWSATAPGQGAGSAGDGAEAGQVLDEGGGAVAVRGDHEGVEHRERLRRTKDRNCCAILVPSSTSARVMRHSELSGYSGGGDGEPHELVRVGGDDLAHPSPPEHAGAVAASEPRSRYRRVGAGQPLGADALVAPLADAGHVTDDVPHLVDVGVHRDRDTVLQLHAARRLRVVRPQHAAACRR